MVGHYIRFYNQYYSVNTDDYADDYIYTLDDIPLFGGIFRGRAKTFNAEITAPEIPGTYLTHYQMIQEGNTWFGDTLEVEITVGQGASINSFDNNGFNIYPNPANNSVLITSLQSDSIYILDINGNVVKSFQNTDKQDSIKIDISGLSSGVYFVKAGKVVRRFVKQ